MQLNIRKIFDSNQTLFLGGETGVGKSSLAKKWAETFKRDQKMVSVNLATLGDSLFEAQMFGYRKGAFTGATLDHPGFLESAGSGVLFLDEIAELSLQSQKKLLGLLEEKTYVPLGSTHSKRFNGMIILATHKDLRLAVERGEFREDLFYRIARLCHCLEPLREKREEIEEALHPWRHKFSFEVMKYLVEKYPWPGNYRELKNFIGLLEFARFDKLTDMSELPLRTIEDTKASPANANDSHCYAEALYQFEKKLFEKALLQAQGRVNYAAERLGISKTTLIAKLKKYGISSLQIKALSHAA